MKYYTGIGSRETPPQMLVLMQAIAMGMHHKGYTLRSGGAEGADKAFETGCIAVGGAKEIYLPWKRFNNNLSPDYMVSKEALEMASEHHPAWERCSEGAKKLHARNMYQILGLDLATPTNVVICWTKDAKGQGGTGQAIRLAQKYNIKVYDLGDNAVKEHIIKQLNLKGE